MPTSSASTTDASKTSAASGGVQSLERAFDLLERMADAGGEVGLSELSASSGLPLPTIHRLMRTLVACGYVRQQANRRYALGPRLIRLGESASRLLGTWARPYLTRLVEETGETANMALLDGDEIVYVAQVPSKHSMRMFTEVGRRVLPHSTGVGKALLAYTAPDEVRALLARTGMPAATEKTITTAEGFLDALEQVRRAGYAVDDNEQEIGVRCLAVSVPNSPTAAAISISGPAGRVTEAATDRIVPILQGIAARTVDGAREHGRAVPEAAGSLAHETPEARAPPGSRVRTALSARAPRGLRSGARRPWSPRRPSGPDGRGRG